MTNEIVYGVEMIEVATINPVTGAINNDWARIENIEEGSVSLTSNTDQRTAITPEDKDAPIIFLYNPGDPDAFNFAALEISPDNAARFFNIIYDITTSLVTVLASRKRANLAVRLTTRAFEGVKKIFTYQNTVCEATYKNNFAKNGLISISVVASILPWTTESGDDAAYTFQKVLEDGTIIDSTPESGTYDTSLTFVSDVSDEAEGVTGTAPATDAVLQFQFNKVLAPIGLPDNMVLKVSTTTVLSVDFPTDYLGKAFKFTNTAGVATGVFTAGNVVIVPA